eukprot:TRINITY_DN5474_c0_g1_i2.p1 TRINITY_DN5474_c0_g1~~TRINITY_DN5474_c0_g1_i2.p1  ORF type:complete len:593 (+),score=84.96 TRINITY_DN5474_c0_g1_i2:28-1806(+)
MNRVYDDLILHITTDKFFIESFSEQQVLLVIDRISHELSLQPNKGQIPPVASRKPIHGILGIINLISGPYLIVVTKKVLQGVICGAEVWRILETEIISFSRAEHHLTESQKEANTRYTGMMQQVLSTPYFYFSYNHDITHARQRVDSWGHEQSLFERADKRFVWNKHLLKPLISNSKMHCYALPVIHGFVSSNPCTISGHKFIWSIISRRNTERVGTRLHTRGIDSQGCVANNVETEQIVECGSDVCSFVQTRGSIPLYWHQRPDLRYKPPPTLEVQKPHLEAFRKHFDAQVGRYGKQVIVNLVDQKKAEGALELSLKAFHKQSQNTDVIYEAFDFHKECSKMRWDRLSILMNRLAQYEEQFQYFHSKQGVAIKKQLGVFRTNCIDCLDRTNVVQSMLARRNLQTVLVGLGILPETARIENQISVEQLFKTVWADHADMISIQYTGTGALKTDFTRTGKRTKMGMLEDGKRSAIRYFKNNFFDGFRQDSLDLFVGNYEVSPTEGVTHDSPALSSPGDVKYWSLPAAFFLSIAMIMLTITVPSQYTTSVLVALLFWAGILFASGRMLLSYGPDYVNTPKLLNAPHNPRNPSKI